MEWSDFNQRLAEVLRETVFGGHISMLIISKFDEDAIYVQFAIEPEGVVSEISSSRRYLPRQWRLDHNAQKLLKAAGWTKPPNSIGPNWTLDLEGAVDFQRYIDYSQRCLAALRELFAITEPSQLVYDAFTHEGMPLELNQLGLARR